MPSTTGLARPGAGVQMFTLPEVGVPSAWARYTEMELTCAMSIGDPGDVSTRSTAAMIGASKFVTVVELQG